ncbi:MAG TPA: DUF4926 domain-containing protein [Acetobacteraceae bacterium]|jgi:hypothetical protein|nr:DUF4926 domain-containing protein [Acetobacteraceae bacterium]
MDHPVGRDLPEVRDLLGAVMSDAKKVVPPLFDLDVVALLTDRPADGLARGQVGTVVDSLGGTDVLVEFGDEDGRAYAVVPCGPPDLLHLRYIWRAA